MNIIYYEKRVIQCQILHQITLDTPTAEAMGFLAFNSVKMRNFRLSLKKFFYYISPRKYSRNFPLAKELDIGYERKGIPFLAFAMV